MCAISERGLNFMPELIIFRLYREKYLHTRPMFRLMSRCKKVAVPTLVVF